LQYILYENPYFRPMTDIDLFIPGQSLCLAKDLLLKMGGCEIFTDPSVFINSLRHESFPIIFNGVAIELHRNLFDVFDNEVALNTQQILRESIQFNFNNFNGLVLSNEMLLLHLCHHAHSTLQGGTVKLIFYFDIHFLIGKLAGALNWIKVQELCEETGAKQSVSKTLYLVSVLFKTKGIPDYYLENTMDKKHYVDLLISAVLNKKANHGRQHYLSKFMKINSFWTKAHYIFNRLLPDKRYIRQKYDIHNPFSLIIYYLVEISTFLNLGLIAFLSYLYSVCISKLSRLKR
jgi:hypothetical protein